MSREEELGFAFLKEGSLCGVMEYISKSPGKEDAGATWRQSEHLQCSGWLKMGALVLPCSTPEVLPAQEGCCTRLQPALQ